MGLPKVYATSVLNLIMNLMLIMMLRLQMCQSTRMRYSAGGGDADNNGQHIFEVLGVSFEFVHVVTNAAVSHLLTPFIVHFNMLITSRAINQAVLSIKPPVLSIKPCYQSSRDN